MHSVSVFHCNIRKSGREGNWEIEVVFLAPLPTPRSITSAVGWYWLEPITINDDQSVSPFAKIHFYGFTAVKARKSSFHAEMMKGFWCETGLIHWRQNDNKWSWVVIDPPQAFIRVTFFQLISTQFILESKIFNIHWKLKKALPTWKFRSLGSILRQDMKRLSPKLSDCVCPSPVVSSSSFVDRSPLVIFACCWKQTSDSIFNISAPVTQW